MPGWTLPGVMTTGAAQTLLRSYRVLPGRRVLVAGTRAAQPAGRARAVARRRRDRRRGGVARGRERRRPAPRWRMRVTPPTCCGRACDASRAGAARRAAAARRRARRRGARGRRVARNAALRRGIHRGHRADGLRLPAGNELLLALGCRQTSTRARPSDNASATRMAAPACRACSPSAIAAASAARRPPWRKG